MNPVSWLRPALTPTMSLYLVDALASARGSEIPTLRRCGPHSFVLGRALILVRQATCGEMDLARRQRRRGGPLVYVIDDDLEAMIGDERLPADYRRRLRARWERGCCELQRLATAILVSSEALRDRFAGVAPTTLLDPYWPLEGGVVSRREDHQRFTVGWLGSRSHAEDLASIASELASFLTAQPGALLLIPGAADLPLQLSRISRHRVRRGPRAAWPVYRERMRSCSMDVGIYPVLDTPVNRARSINKVLEHAWCGVPGLYSREVPFARRIEESAGGCLIGSGEWGEALWRLSASPAARDELLRRSNEFAVRIADQSRKAQIAFWAGQSQG